MLKGRKHLFHIVNASPWPIVTAFSAFFFVTGLAFVMHRIELGTILFFVSFLSLLISAFYWSTEIIDEATFTGYHTNIVRNGLKSGFLLFIVSEIMLFFGFFWAFFHSSLCPAGELGLLWPPYHLNSIPVVDYPLLNTLILITSGFAVTWSHRGIAIQSYKNALDGLCLAILLGVLFIVLQGFEYYEAAFNISDNVYSCVFFMLTGLHGFHVVVGIILLFISLVRIFLKHFLINHYTGFVLAVWYWHFVDGVWILLFITLYCWGNW